MMSLDCNIKIFSSQFIRPNFLPIEPSLSGSLLTLAVLYAYNAPISEAAAYIRIYAHDIIHT